MQTGTILTEMQTLFTTQQRWIDQQTQATDSAILDIRTNLATLNQSATDNTTILQNIQQQFVALTRSTDQMARDLNSVASYIRMSMPQSAMED